MKKILLTLILSLLTSLAFSQTSFMVDGIQYTTTGFNTVEVSSGGTYNESITIPSSVPYSGRTYNVISIGIKSFYGCTGLTSITIPSSVTSIGSNAFYGCTGLISITIPSSVLYIADWTFFGCIGLITITIPSPVRSIGYSAFGECTGLTTIIIPSSLTSIGDLTFSGCTGLTSITIPSSVRSIGNSTFSGCAGLTTITIPSSVTSIGSYAFSGCTGLTSITIPSSVTSIGISAFLGCIALITVEAKNNYYSSKDGVLYNKGYTTLIRCPTSLKQEFTIPSSVTSIGVYAFYGCTGLTSITIPSSVTSIVGSAFSGCTGLTTLTIPSSVTSIGAWAFRGCSGLTSITIPSSVTSIEASAFSGCVGLINVDSNNNNYSSKDGVLYNKDYTTLIQCPTSLKQMVTIPLSVTSIGNLAFFGCTGLTSIAIPSSVTSIGSGAFWECTGLTSITIPSSVTSIGTSAFYNCTVLSEIRVNAVAPPTVGSGTFEFVDKTKCILYVPTGSLSTYQSTEQWKDFLNIFEFDATGVENPSAELIKLYPNPTSQFIHINLVDNIDSPILKIFNASGQKFYEMRESDNHIQIDVSSYPSGLYFIQTTDQNNRVTNIGRFIRE